MSKGKKKVILILLLAVLGVALVWGFWQQPLSLAQQLPETEWKTIRVNRGLEHLQTWEFLQGSDVWDEFNAALEQTSVTRWAGKVYDLNEVDFELFLYPESGSRTVVYVKENGIIAVASEGEFDHYQYYDSGEELFQQLSKLLDD